MRILLITWNYRPKTGGMENMLCQLVEQWKKSIKVDVIGPYSETHKSKPDSILRPRKTGLLYFMFSAFNNGFRLLRKRNIDLIMTGSALMTPIAVILGLLFRRPVVSQVHGLDLIYDHPVYQRLLRLFLPRSSLIICNSQNTADIAEKQGIPKQKLRVVNPGIVFSEFSDALIDGEHIREKFDLTGRRVILSAGRLAKRKGIPEFIEHALPTLVEHIPDLLFLIAGDNPTQSLSHKDDIKGRIGNSVRLTGLEDHVRVLGHVSRHHLLELYSIADVFVLPAIHIESDVEGFGIVLLEAGAAGCPVVATRIGGIPDAVADNETGILTEEGNWDEMTRAIEHLLTDQSAAESMGTRARARAEHMFDWPVVSSQYLKHFKSVVRSD